MMPAGGVLARFEKDRGACVAEQYAVGPVGVVGNGAHFVGADDDHFFARAVLDELCARHEREGKPEQAAETSNPHAFFAPMRSWIRHAVDGKNMSGVTVATMMRSISAAEIPLLASVAWIAFDGKVRRGTLAEYPPFRRCLCVSGSTRPWCRPSSRSLRW